MFNIITRRTLNEYARLYPMAASSLFEWYHEFAKLDFDSFNELKERYKSASLVGDDRVVFNIMGNKFRLVVRVVFAYKAVQVKWFGPHSDYDRIDVTTINYKK